MKTFVAILISTTLAGCSVMNAAINDLNDTAGELLGTYSAPTLAGSPTPSGCGDQRCRTLDAVEEKGYELARQKKITWVKLVDVFYKKRAELYPDSNDSSGANEIRRYQRALAEQMDLGKMTESQWAYLVEKKSAEVNARNQALSNSAPRQRNCTTTNVGTRSFPEYKTTCN